jgi:hypothetical protein
VYRPNRAFVERVLELAVLVLGRSQGCQFTLEVKQNVTINDALADPRLLGGLPQFANLTSWARWIVFLKAIDGLPVSDDERAVFRAHTGRVEPRPGGYPEAVAIVGVQSGKSQIAAAMAAFAAITGQDGTHALLIAQDQRSALRTLLRYARQPFEARPMFAAEVARDVADTLELRNGVSLSAYPCKPASIRGLRACIAVIDELAFFVATDGRPVDQEMLRAARGRVATTGGKLIVLSSPYAASGALYDLHRKHYGRDDSPVLVWQASAPAMNPTLPADYLARMQQDDPEAYRSEVLGEFRQGVSTFLNPQIVAEAVDAGVRERPYQHGVAYVSFDDPASGSGADAWTKAIAHRERDRVVLDVLRAWMPPFNPSGVIAESAALSKAYGLRATTGDRYAPGFVLEGFRAHSITYALSARDRSVLYLELLPLMNAGRIRLLDLPDLLRELRGLERRRGTAGRDRVDHMPGSHDDRANAVAGALVLAAGRDATAAAEVIRWALNLGTDESRLSASMPMASDGCPRP